ncbi:MAG: glutathione S-transferase family protein, partial [Pseudomonadota bacterium]
MSDIILHHYPESPYSEKIRAIFGLKGLSWKSVVIPIIMPKPDLMPLTGGYRKTPVIQIGNHVYCDTQLIARVIDRLHPEPALYPDSQAANANVMAAWMDKHMFSIAVALIFQPQNLAAMMSNLGGEASAFAQDRAELMQGATLTPMSLEAARDGFRVNLERLNTQLASAENLAGESISIADFSTYHLLWFVQQNPAARELLTPYTNVTAWVARMAALGHGSPVEMSGAEALDVAKNNKLDTENAGALVDLPDIAI